MCVKAKKNLEPSSINHFQKLARAASKANDAERRWSVGRGSAYIPKPITIGKQETEKDETIPTKRECHRCGIKQESSISEDAQGNITQIGCWEKTKKQ
jgi:hypothetical protein